MTQTVLITRTQIDSEDFARLLYARLPDVPVLVAPLVTIEPIDAMLPAKDYAALLLTSRHAVPFAATHFPDAITLCVGDATAQTARDHGLRATSAQGAAQELIALAKSKGRAPMLHLHGTQTRGAVATHLNAAGLATDACVVYGQNPRNWSQLESDTIAEAKTLIVPLFSPKSAARVARNLEEYKGEIDLCAMSDATLAAFGDGTYRRAIVATQPSADAMIDAIAQLTAGS